MQFLIIIILLGFPLLELWLLIDLTFRYGWTFIGYLALVGFLGYRLLQDEKFSMMGRMAQSLRAGQSPVGLMFGMFKNTLAGVLLIIPGVLTDAIALVLLLWPSPATPANDDLYQQSPFERDGDANRHPHSRAEPNSTKASNPDVIEGEYRREEE